MQLKCQKYANGNFFKNSIFEKCKFSENEFFENKWQKVTTCKNHSKSSKKVLISVKEEEYNQVRR